MAKSLRFDYEHLYIGYHYSSRYDPAERLKRRHIKALLGNVVNEATAALDIGGGAGILVDALIELGGKAPNYFCLDIAQNQLRIHSDYMRSKGYRAHPVQGDAQILPVKSNTLDLIFCCEVLEHLESDISAVSEMNRILRGDGNLVISVPYAGRLSERERRTLGHLNSYDVRALERLARGCGFRIQEVLFISRFTHLLWTFPKLIIYLIWLLLTKNLLKRLRGLKIPSYYDTALHRNFVMPVVERLLILERACSKSPHSILGRAASTIMLLKKTGSHP